VRLEVDAVQDPADLGGGDRQPGDPQVASQQPVGPRRVRARRGLGRGGDDPQLVLRRQAGTAERPGPVGQRGQAFGGEAFAPGADGVDMPPGCAGRGGVRHPVGHRQDHAGPLHLYERRGTRIGHLFQSPPLGLGQTRSRTDWSASSSHSEISLLIR
jgi:hypothetical protein